MTISSTQCRKTRQLGRSTSALRIEKLRTRAAPLDMTSDQFRSLGHDLVDRIADFLASIRTHPVTRAESPEEVRAALSANAGVAGGGAGSRVPATGRRRAAI